MKGLAAGNLYPLPNYPYGGYSYSNLSKLMMGMEFPSLCAVLGRTVLMGAFGASPCGFKTFVHEGIQKTSQTLSGLELNDILNPPNLEENVESSSKV